MPSGRTVYVWATLRTLWPGGIEVGGRSDVEPGLVLVVGLLILGGVFAIKASVHSYLILALAQRESASLDLGFYYMANAGGRLLGTLLSGLMYQQYGLISCLLMSSLLIAISALLARDLKPQSS